jgi:hypothetical protein
MKAFFVLSKLMLYFDRYTLNDQDQTIDMLLEHLNSLNPTKLTSYNFDFKINTIPFFCKIEMCPNYATKRD